MREVGEGSDSRVEFSDGLWLDLPRSRRGELSDELQSRRHVDIVVRAQQPDFDENGNLYFRAFCHGLDHRQNGLPVLLAK